MIGQWITWLNFALLGSALLLGLSGGIFWLKRPSEIACANLPTKECGLPKGAFELAEQAYNQIGAPLLALEEVPPTMQLPDLRQQLIYYGKNGRPDAQTTHTLLHFSLNGNKAVVSTPPGEKLYLVYDRKSTPGRYVFSSNNEKSSLWIVGDVVDNEVLIQVTLENDKGEKILEPEVFAQFRLNEKEFIRFAGTSWEIGSFRVDGTLLARQRARWYGVDRFLEDHGGRDHQNNIGKQRIDFGETDALYSVFVKTGDCLIWDNNCWSATAPGEESLGHPLLVVKKIDERLVTFELWDVEGKGKILLNLLKSTEPWAVQNAQSLQHMFKFVGARTRTQCVFEINRERMTLKPSDWLLLTPKGWKKLSTEEEIDHYVKRKLTGTLFVFEGISRKDERQIMTGKLYSPSRNDSQPVELALQVKGTKPSVSRETKEAKEVKGTKDDDDDDDGPPTHENEILRHPMTPAPKSPVSRK
jgi:hypothetical protein